MQKQDITYLYNDSGYTRCDIVYKNRTFTGHAYCLDVDKDSLKFIDTIERKKKYVDIYYMETDIKLDNLSIQKEELDEVLWMSKKEIDLFGSLIGSTFSSLKNLSKFLDITLLVK